MAARDFFAYVGPVALRREGRVEVGLVFGATAELGHDLQWAKAPGLEGSVER